MRDVVPWESGLPLQGRGFSQLPVPGGKTPGYSWENRSAGHPSGKAGRSAFSQARAGAVFSLLLLLLCFIASTTARAAGTVIVVTGAPGETQFSDTFTKQSASWKEAALAGGAKVVEIGSGAEDEKEPDMEKLRAALAAEKPDGTDALWIVFNGHGTWDGKQARFNLRGPDVSADDLAAWLKPVKRPAVIINTASSSAPFLAKLTAPGRIVITATRSGSEQNLTRFGGYLAVSWQDEAADLDTDGAVSLLEAFLAASRRTLEFYKSENRLATEHALIEDNGDGMGTPAEWFRGLRAVKKSDKGAATDGAAARYLYLIPPAQEKSWTAELLKERESLEARIAALRESKEAMKEDDYYAKLEPLLLELARLNAKAESR